MKKAINFRLHNDYTTEKTLVTLDNKLFDKEHNLTTLGNEVLFLTTQLLKLNVTDQFSSLIAKSAVKTSVRDNKSYAKSGFIADDKTIALICDIINHHARATEKTLLYCLDNSERVFLIQSKEHFFPLLMRETEKTIKQVIDFRGIVTEIEVENKIEREFSGTLSNFNTILDMALKTVEAIKAKKTKTA